MIELGCHTHTHQDFRHRPECLLEDLHASLEVLRQDFGIEHPTFSFPFGIADWQMTQVARQAGLSCGLTTSPRLAPVADDSFTWGRFNVSQSETAATLTVKLSGWFNALRSFSQPPQFSSIVEAAP
jgi:peptidoglycan/xylan/chitin deacetylase (PgdA/CDA1 family)